MSSATVELNIGESPKLDYCNLYCSKLKNPIYKNFVDDLNKDRKKDMTFFYNNLETLKVKKIRPYKGICYDAAAQYNMTENVIELITLNRYKTFIDHELLHMASTIKDENGNIYSGFIQLRGENGIGYGIDEGYTALLDDRYFLNRTEEKKTLNKKTYCLVKYLAGMVEEFVGKEDMEDLYFEANLFELVDFLSSYTSLDEAGQFIHNIDIILTTYEQARFKRRFLCLKKFAECNLFMAEAWYARVTQGYIDGKLTKDEYKACLEDIKRMLRNRVTIGHFPIQSYNTEDYYDIIKRKVDKKLIKVRKRKDTTNTN